MSFVSLVPNHSDVHSYSLDELEFYFDMVQVHIDEVGYGDRTYEDDLKPIAARLVALYPVLTRFIEILMQQVEQEATYDGTVDEETLDSFAQQISDIFDALKGVQTVTIGPVRKLALTQEFLNFSSQV